MLVIPGGKSIFRSEWHMSEPLDTFLLSSVMGEQFVRNFQFFGEEGQTAIMNARVVVVGLGGVGSHTAVTLARSGVGSNGEGS